MDQRGRRGAAEGELWDTVGGRAAGVCGWPGMGLGVWGQKAGKGRPVGAWSQAQVKVGHSQSSGTLSRGRESPPIFGHKLLSRLP